MEQAVQRNQRSKKCPAVQKIAEKRVEIVGCKGKKSDEKQPMKIQSTALKTRKTVEMDHVRRRLSSSSNNVSNMRLDGAMGIPLQVQVSKGFALTKNWKNLQPKRKFYFFSQKFKFIYSRPP
jgi:hypothetical protein